MLTLKIILFSCMLLVIGGFMADNNPTILAAILMFIGITGVVTAPLLASMIKEDV